MTIPLSDVFGRLGRCAACVAAMGIVAAPAWAQVERQPRGYRGLFGGSASGGARAQSLDFTGQVDVGRDQNLRPGGNANSQDPRYRVSASFVGTAMRLAYNRQSERFDFSSYAGGQFRQYRASDPFSSHDLRAGIGARIDLGRSTSLLLSQAATWTPYFQLDLIPELVLPGLGEGGEMAFDFAVDATNVERLATRAALTQELGRRSSLQVVGSYTRASFSSETRPDTVGRSAGVTFRRGLTRYSGIRLGYRRTETRYGNGVTLQRDDIQAGVDYRRSLSFSRRTTVGFSSGSSYYKNTLGNGRFRVLGNVALQHDMARSWSLLVNASRNVLFVDGVDEPLFADSVRAQLSGHLNRRSLLSMGAGLAGGSQRRVGGNNYRVITGDALYQLALTRLLAAYVQYVQYHYDYDGAPVASILNTRVNRHSVRGGVTMWLPVLR